MEVPFAATVVIYVVGSCVLGIFFANLIEFPVLRFRDRFWPMRQQAGMDPAHVEQGKLPAGFEVA